jgi:2-C-methyl-D-erythritol 4-phosphate cytidylyltransferase
MGSDLTNLPWWGVVLAAGSGARFGGPKQLAAIGPGERMVDRAVRTLRPIVPQLVVAITPGSEWDGDADVRVVAGGPSRVASMRAVLAAIPDDDAVVVVHDAAHPLVSTALCREVATTLVARGVDGVVPALPIAEALVRVDGEQVLESVPKTALVLVGVPHAFRLATLRRAHAGEPEASDDSVLVLRAGGSIVTVPGEHTAIHVIDAGSLAAVRRLAPVAPLRAG